MWLSDLTIVLPGGVLDRGSVRLEAGRITEVIEGPAPKSGLELPGRMLMPGFVDIHGDMLEREIEPRPKTHFPVDLALLEVDKRLAANGVTTAFAAIAFSWEDFGDLRSEERARSIMAAVTDLRPELLSDHFVHARFAITNAEAGKVLEELTERGQVHLISLMDHTPGQGQYRDIEAYIKFAIRWRRQTTGQEVSEAQMREHISKMQERPKAWDVVREIVELAKARNIHLASHDDDTLEKVELMAEFGVDISEFPVNMESARAAREKGFHVAMGAPNAFRGVSSTKGNLSATDAIREGFVDVLATDYYPAAMLQAAWALKERGVLPLHDAVKLVTRNPAVSVGLDDRGSIEPGKRADLVIVEPGRIPRVRGSLLQGTPIYWDHTLPHVMESGAAVR